MADTATEHFGGIDFLVNNAAIFGGMKLDFLLTVEWEYLERFLDVNLLGALVCTRACYQSMAARGGGAIVNQSSTAAYLYAGYYGWAKAGVNSLTQQLAHELGGMNIRVNAIAPGPTDTEAARSVVPDQYMRDLVGSLAHGADRWQGQRRHTYEWVIDLLRAGKLSTEGMITHRFRFEQYRQAVAVSLDKKTARPIKVAFCYD